MDDLAKLREAAEAATPGPWWHAVDADTDDGSVLAEVGPEMVLTVADAHDYENDEQSKNDARFIARANPETILALLSAHASALARVAVLEGALRDIMALSESLPQHGVLIGAWGRARVALRPDEPLPVRAALRTEGEGQ